MEFTSSSFKEREIPQARSSQRMNRKHSRFWYQMLSKYAKVISAVENTTFQLIVGKLFFWEKARFKVSLKKMKIYLLNEKVLCNFNELIFLET